jgi:hypothetical protein
MELPTSINIHLVFYKLLLEKAPLNAKLGPVLIYKETQEPLYNVERILNHSNETPRRYLIKWLGYDDSENTWEPTENLPRGLIR